MLHAVGMLHCMWGVKRCIPLGVFGSFECRISNDEEDDLELEMRAAEEF
jgi:hypothetical protein